jgi:hypothetical protein
LGQEAGQRALHQLGELDASLIMNFNGTISS